jgi:hypothetical protein
VIANAPIIYEDVLKRDCRLALREGSMHFEKESSVFKALDKIVGRLTQMGVPFVVAGGMALFLHGYRRFTEDVDILVNREGLAELHRQLEGRGYLPPFAGSKHLRDTELGVRVEFRTNGDFPGDGKPKPVAFPDPAAARVDLEGIPCLNLPRLIELKLASGMTNPGRLRDLADVQQVIRQLHLPKDFDQQLDPYVRGKFQEMWTAVQENPEEG